MRRRIKALLLRTAGLVVVSPVLALAWLLIGLLWLSYQVQYAWWVLADTYALRTK